MDARCLRSWIFDEVGLLMVTMPKTFIHEQHNAMPGISMLEYLISNARRNDVPIPSENSDMGTVKARLHRGRWIVDCPESDCFGACVVTSLDPVYFCPDCGSGWYKVIFPKNKAKIEEEVLKRRVTRQGLVHANWEGESLKQLREQTAEAEL